MLLLQPRSELTYCSLHNLISKCGPVSVMLKDYYTGYTYRMKAGQKGRFFTISTEHLLRMTYNGHDRLLSAEQVICDAGYLSAGTKRVFHAN